jgi:AcrR family transcriptional regulator
MASNDSHPSTSRAVIPNSGEMTGAGRRPRVALDTEASVLDLSFRFPARGQDRISRDLREKKIHLSASGVRYVWQRHDLETLHKRVAWIESRLGKKDQGWSEEQLAARDRMRADRVLRTAGAAVSGPTVEELPRSMYILIVAAKLLRARSFDAVSLRDIAVASHIPLGSIYYHFPTKEEMFAAVYEEGISRLQLSIGQATLKYRDPWERLERACVAHLENLCGGDDFIAVSIPTSLPELSLPVRRRVHQLGDGYEQVFRELIEALPLASDLSRTLLRLQILGALNWTSVWFKAGKQTPAEIAEQMVRAFRFGVEKSKRRPATT